MKHTLQNLFARLGLVMLVAGLESGPLHGQGALAASASATVPASTAPRFGSATNGLPVYVPLATTNPAPSNAIAPTNRVAPPAPAPSPVQTTSGATNTVQPQVKFPEPFNRLNYSPMPKPDFPGNPRREVRGIYVTLHSAASSNALARLMEVVDSTEINALVIDVKDDVGLTLHRSAAAAAYNPKAAANAPVKDLSVFAKRLRDRGVYLIARIVTFKDPLYARMHPDRAIVNRRTGQLFRSKDGLAWASPYDADYRVYNLEVAKEAALAGFNEIQFDYIRFPEVPASQSVDYRNKSRQTKAEAVQSFLIEARRQLHPLNAYVSADVFGLVCAARDDMDIGQYWEAMSNAVDFISPMSYPSHYAPGSYGLAVPDLRPYDLMERATRDAFKRNRNIATPARVRPWIQGFTARWLPKYKKYGVEEIKAQIKAIKDNGINSYLVWNPGNHYKDQAPAFK